jgi:hypothetical protein
LIVSASVELRELDDEEDIELESYLNNLAQKEKITDIQSIQED